MVLIKVKCRICKAITDHQEVIVTDTLPPNVACLECLGCGVLGIELINTYQQSVDNSDSPRRLTPDLSTKNV